MLTAIHQLLKQQLLIDITFSQSGADSTAAVMIYEQDEEGKATLEGFSRAFTLTGSPQEIEAALPQAITSITISHKSIQETLAELERENTREAKLKKEEVKKKKADNDKKDAKVNPPPANTLFTNQGDTNASAT